MDAQRNVAAFELQSGMGWLQFETLEQQVL